MSVTKLSKAEDGRCLVLLTGEIDLAVAPELVTELEYAVTAISPHLVLDVGGVEFIDSSGLSALVTTQRRAHEQGGSLVLTAAPEHITDLLRLTRLDAVLTLEPDLPEAPASLAEQPRPSRTTGSGGLTDGQRRAMLALGEMRGDTASASVV